MTPQVIDLSSNNGTSINFNKVAAAGVREVFIRTSMGYGCKDKDCEILAEAADKAGLPVNYYHFSYPDKKSGNGTVDSDATAEADYFCDTIQSMPKYTRIAIDCERFNATSDTPLTASEYTEWLSTFLDHVYARTGVQCLLYGTADYLNHKLVDNHGLADKCSLWLANYNNISSPPIPKGFSTYTLWQYSESGSVDGIAGHVDSSLFNPANSVA